MTSIANVPPEAGSGLCGTTTTMMTVATCNLNQWAMDFDGNLARVVRSIAEAKARGATYRLGPELELCGYGCEDHFLEMDTFQHCDESLAEILRSDLTDGMLCDIGLPVLHKGVRYNCRAFCLDRRILLIRPKLFMADDGNYRETRYFSPWKREATVDQHQLSPLLREATGQATVPFGCAAIEAQNTSFGGETCEELWTPQAPHIKMSLSGVEVIGNGSGSHHQLRKLDTRLELITAPSTKMGGVYLYANQRGCDGSRLYFDGGALIVVNGQLVAQASQFGVEEVEVITATVDLEVVRSYRASVSSLCDQAAATDDVPLIRTDHWLGHTADEVLVRPSPFIQPRYHSPEEECAYGPACWLWDYLRRSGAAGYFLALSGGADSASVAAIVGCMCTMLAESIKAGNEDVRAQVQRVCGDDAELDLTDPAVIASRVLYTCFMGSTNSSEETRSRALRLAGQIGAVHNYLQIDTITDAIISVFSTFISGGRTPQFITTGGSMTEDLALQNIQARCRMTLAYLLAQLLPWVHGRRGFLLVLSSANVDEGLRGYMTKYDCSAADLNPIGSISKLDLKRLLKWAGVRLSYPALLEVEQAPPTAELRPDDGAVVQTDEEDMGMTYEELWHFGRLRKLNRCGPVSMFNKLLDVWTHLSATAIAEKVQRFFYFYSVNRHKMTTLTPSYHAESYSPDDNRYDLRQFLYNTKWPRQNRCMHALAQRVEAQRAARDALVEGKAAGTTV